MKGVGEQGEGEWGREEGCRAIQRAAPSQAHLKQRPPPAHPSVPSSPRAA